MRKKNVFVLLNILNLPRASLTQPALQLHTPTMIRHWETIRIKQYLKKQKKAQLNLGQQTAQLTLLHKTHP